MKIIRNLIRILVGIVFIFSSIVKGVDPLGTVYRMDDYFTAFSMPFFMQFSLFFAILLCALEFILGISLLFNLCIRKTSWLLLPMMIFFTVLTFFDAVYSPVPDCGCFGDAIKLTNLQTFLKNLVLMALVIAIFMWRKKYRSLLPQWGDVALLILAVCSFTWMSVYAYRHLPLIDFMSWKVGNRINEKSKQPVIFYVTYKNKSTGEEKEFISPNYPWNDSVWLSQWIFKSQRVVDPNADQSVALRIEDAQGSDYTPAVIDNPDFQFILVAYDLENTDIEGFRRILPFAKKATADGYSLVCLTNTIPPDIKKFRMANGAAFDFYNSDDVVLKTMVRSNPGLILIRDGVVLAKWPFRDFPSYESVRKEFLNR